MRLVCLLCLLSCGLLNSQTLSNSSLTGKYFVRHVQFSTGSPGAVTDARSIIGALTFDGKGGYSFTGAQVVGKGTAASYTTSGTYAVNPAGIVTIANPQNPALTVNARLGIEAVVGSSTEAAENTFDLFVAIPAPTILKQNSTTLDSNFFFTDLELNNAAASGIRTSFIATSFDGAGNIPPFSVTGHAADMNAQTVFSQDIPGAAYRVDSDGTGLIRFGDPPNAYLGALLGNALRILLVSQSGNVVLAGNPGAHDILIGVKSIFPPATAASLNGRYWVSGLRLDTTGSALSYTGSSTAIVANRALISGKRVHQSTATTPNPITVTQADAYTIAANGTGTLAAARFGVAAGSTALVSANQNQKLDLYGYEIGFAVAMPPLSGSGVFLNPQGIVNAASNVPAGDAISPGEFIALYGSGLAAAPVVSLPPYPASLGGVTVTIGGLPAPLYAVSATQINCLVPYGVTGPTASITVTNNGVASNTVTVPLANTSPGVFSLDQSGTAAGAILKADNTPVTSIFPAHRGDVVQMYLGGLGALSTPVPDGRGATAADSVAATVKVLVNGLESPQVSYAGLSSLPGLYQINFQVPPGLTATGALPVTVRTPEATHTQVTIAIQ